MTQSILFLINTQLPMMIQHRTNEPSEIIFTFFRADNWRKERKLPCEFQLFKPRQLVTSPLAAFNDFLLMLIHLFSSQINDSRTLNTIYDDNEFLSEAFFVISFVRQWNFHPIATFLANWLGCCVMREKIDENVLRAFVVDCFGFSLLSRDWKHWIAEYWWYFKKEFGVIEC